MDSELLPARVKDLKYLCEKTSAPKFFGFLTPDELATATRCLKCEEGYAFYGGYDAAERTVLAFLPDWCDTPAYPITALTFTYRKCDALAHRDFLGALMALGIARETVGDILIESGRTVVFVLSDIADFIVSQISLIGRVGVTVKKGFDMPLPSLGQKQASSVTVASLRLDCAVAALCGLSRKEANEKICDGCVMVNSICIQKPTAVIASGSTLTVRQKGRFEITACEELSKKGRIILRYNKYI